MKSFIYRYGLYMSQGIVYSNDIWAGSSASALQFLVPLFGENEDTEIALKFEYRYEGLKYDEDGPLPYGMLLPQEQYMSILVNSADWFAQGKTIEDLLPSMARQANSGWINEVQFKEEIRVKLSSISMELANFFVGVGMIHDEDLGPDNGQLRSDTLVRAAEEITNSFEAGNTQNPALNILRPNREDTAGDIEIQVESSTSLYSAIHDIFIPDLDARLRYHIWANP